MILKRREMKFKENEILYYVCPFLFTIELIKVEMAVKEEKYLYYIDETGAYLKEENLHDNIFSAQEYAYNQLTKFFDKKTKEILNSNPKRKE